MGGSDLDAVLQVLGVQAALFEAALLAASAVHKALDWEHLRTVMHDFVGVPEGSSGIVLMATMSLEAMAAVLLLPTAHRAAGALLATGIWCSYLVFILRAILGRRRDMDCGCSFGSASRPLGAYQVVRNASLALLSVWIAWAAVHDGVAMVTQASQVLGGMALLAAYAALDQVMALRPLRGGEVL